MINIEGGRKRSIRFLINHSLHNFSETASYSLHKCDLYSCIDFNRKPTDLKGVKEMRIFWRIIVLLVLIAAILGIGLYAYNAGMAYGFAQKATAQGGQSVPAPYPYYWPPFFGFGYGFGFLGCLIPLFLLFLVFGSMRALFWHGPMGWRRHMHHGPWGWREENEKDVPPFFDQWHRRAHEKPEDESEKQ